MLTPPIRVLLVTARPEDAACGYIDHRASALPLVEAMEALGGLVSLTVLHPPTLPDLRKELDRTRHAGQPYHVVHFDGHGVYDRRVGLGGLCFEEPEDTHKLTQRRHATVYTDELGPLLRDHRIPLVFLEACQTAQAESGTESVASALLQAGVASVVAMSHSVLVETARRFVQAFYGALTQGARVGAAMLEGQRVLKENTARGRVFGLGELRLEDWFVPVLFQEEQDPQLFTSTPAPQTRADILARLAQRLGNLPKAPETGFIGRSRELLALQRLLDREGNAMPAGAGANGQRYAVLRGQGGEGKTALSAEFGRWMVRSGQVYRTAFVSVEAHSTPMAVLSALGGQFIHQYSAAAFETLEAALQPVERELRQQATLLVIDNMESILLPPYVSEATALSADMRENLGAILKLCERLGAIGETRLLFTSREALPPPFDAQGCRLELQQLSRDDAIKLVERTLNQTSSPLGEPADAASSAGAGAGAAAAAKGEAIETLVKAVHCHARTLTLVAPSLRSQGVESTHAALVELMAQMEAQFPGDREKSVYASVELSLRRLSPENRDRARVLGVFHGGVQLNALRLMTQWEESQVGSLATELVGTGLATPDKYNHLTLNPALCPYLRAQLAAEELANLEERWVGAMRGYVEALVQELRKNAQIPATLTVLELPNLFALLDRVQAAGDAVTTLDLTTSLESLLQWLGRPRLLERVAAVREAAAKALGCAWNRAAFEAQRKRIEEWLGRGELREAFDGARQLLECAQRAGETAYPDAHYDLAMAFAVLGRVLSNAGGREQALPLLEEAQRRFEAVATAEPGRGAERMASVCLAEQGNCLQGLGRLDEAAEAHQARIRRAEELGDTRGVAVGKGQLGMVRLLQRRYDDALQAYVEARETFESLGEPGTGAGIWHQIGVVHQEAGNPEAAEDAYRRSLTIKVRLNDVPGQASTLGQLGILYGDVLGRREEAVAFFRQAADKYVQGGNAAGEGRQRNNLADELRKLARETGSPERLDEARQEIQRAIECKAQFGHVLQPWTTWDILCDIETDAGNPAAAAEARNKAVAAYLAYRHDGGENHDGPGRLCHVATQGLLSGDTAQAGALLAQLAERPEARHLHELIRALQAIMSGSRDRSLAKAPGLDYTMAAEVLWLIETLEAARTARGCMEGKHQWGDASS